LGKKFGKDVEGLLAMAYFKEPVIYQRCSGGSEKNHKRI
jgi:hypothetical protein